MEIRRITEDEVESFTEYMKLLLYMNGSLSNLSEMIFDGKKYVISYDGDSVAAVLNDGESLKPYIINVEDPMYKIFGTDEYVYNIVESELREVIKSAVDESEEVRVTYLPRVDNFPRDIIEFSQYKRDINHLLEFAYDVTNRPTLSAALEFTKYHMPDNVRLQYTKSFLNFVFRKTHYYNLGCEDESTYYMPLFVINGREYGTKKTTLDSSKMMNQIEEFNFLTEIPEDFKTIITDTNEEYKTLKLIAKEYKNFIKGQ